VVLVAAPAALNDLRVALALLDRSANRHCLAGPSPDDAQGEAAKS
jgi:hypothetical protein